MAFHNHLKQINGEINHYSIAVESIPNQYEINAVKLHLAFHRFALFRFAQQRYRHSHRDQHPPNHNSLSGLELGSQPGMATCLLCNQLSYSFLPVKAPINFQLL